MALVLWSFETEPQTKYIHVFYAVLTNKTGRIVNWILQKFNLIVYKSDEIIIIKLQLNICLIAELLRRRNTRESEETCLWNVYILLVTFVYTLRRRYHAIFYIKASRSLQPLDSQMYLFQLGMWAAEQDLIKMSQQLYSIDAFLSSSLLFWKLDSKRLETISDIPNIYESTQ